ncbi:AraC family transcriptional regulator ligand-binding domain-containing protein [Pseudomonas sp. NPDC089996]|uniref:AraC family transcriptional regulator n=1 Tax=Pseudomonas sp. NPDC089996 TaxID=3364474 RepID=UPI003829EACD
MDSIRDRHEQLQDSKTPPSAPPPLSPSIPTAQTPAPDYTEGFAKLKFPALSNSGLQTLAMPCWGTAMVDGAPLAGPLRFLATTAPTVGHALVALVRYMGQYSPLIHFRLEHRAGQAVLHFEPSAPAQSLTPHTVENWVVAAWWLIGELRGTQLKLTALSFKHPPLVDEAKYVNFFECAIAFNQSSTCLIMASNVLEETIVKQDAQLHEMVRYFLEVRAQPADGLKGEVEALIKILLPSHRCTLEQVALALELNPRTLQRRLSHEAIDFEECLDNIRRSQAERMLRKTALTVGQISSELGYRRTTSFCRAHQRWFDMTPLEHRRQFGGRNGTCINS